MSLRSVAGPRAGTEVAVVTSRLHDVLQVGLALSPKMVSIDGKMTRDRVNRHAQKPYDADGGEMTSSQRHTTERMSYLVPEELKPLYLRLRAVMKLSPPWGLLGKTHDRIVLSTDLEPDDMIAIRLLKPVLHGKTVAFIVGEAKANKLELLHEVLNNYGIEPAPQSLFLQGAGSDAPFPMIPESADAITSSPDVVKKSYDELEKFLQDAKSPFAILLKPPREVLQVKSFSKARGILYGSFNLVAMKVKQEHVAARMERLFVVERAALVGRDSVITDESTPFLFKDDDYLTQKLTQWNEHVLNKSIEALSKLEVLTNDGIGQYFDEAVKKERLKLLVNSVSDDKLEKLKKLDNLDELKVIIDGAAQQAREIEDEKSANAIEKLSKKIGIVKPNVRHNFIQTPNADPLLVAVLAQPAKFGRNLLSDHENKLIPVVAPEHSHEDISTASFNIMRSLLLAAKLLAPLEEQWEFNQKKWIEKGIDVENADYVIKQGENASDFKVRFDRTYDEHIETYVASNEVLDESELEVVLRAFVEAMSPEF